MAKALSTHQMSALSVGSLEAYMQRANQVPLLSAEEELELAQRFYQHNDLEAARRLVMSHLRYVVRVARGYRGYGLPLGDLIQEGNTGLMKAVKKFKPSKGVRLVSFAVHWIKSEIHEYVLRNWRIVKVATTKAQRKLFFNLRRYKKRLGWFTKEEIKAVARDLGVSTKEVLCMEERLNAHDLGYDGSSEEDAREDQTTFAPQTYLAHKIDPLHLLEQVQRHKLGQAPLSQAISQLDDRSQHIIRHRWLSEKKSTLHELAKKYAVSPERIRQIEQSAMQKLKQALAA